jgi:Flp pilus assembly protein TadB
MSRDRARRRAEREAAAALERERRARERRRRERRAAAGRALAWPFRPVTAALRATGALVDDRHNRRTALGRARSRENGGLLAVILAVHVVLWLLTSSWWLRGSALVLTVLAWPVLTVMLFDRRPTR